jgi:small GTP-binding protein
MKVGFVNIFGKPNAGKSTLLNALLGEKLAIVSPKVQTTRHRIKGILTTKEYQIIFSDTPGIIDPKYKLQEKMMGSVKSALEDADVALLLLDIKDNWQENDELFASLKLKVPTVVVLNKIDLVDTAKLAEAKAFPGLAGMELAKEVTVDKPYAWTQGEWTLKGYVTGPTPRFKVVAYDFGVKRNRLRKLAERGCDVTVVPAQTPAAEVLAMNPDGVFLSNGPGDPEPCDYAIAAIREFLAVKKPVYGICLGHQLLALAAGAKTAKMKFGHHGANHPVKDVDTGQVLITSQNHGFAADVETLPANVRVTHVSLFDGTLQGIALTDAPAFSFQGHPEASPGPHDVSYLFDRFIDLMSQHAAK